MRRLAASIGRIAALARREVREVVRDPMYFALAFIAPPLMMLVIGFGLDFDVEGIRLAAVDHDRTPASRDLVDRFANSRFFELVGHLDSEREIDDLLMRGRVRAVVVVPPRFASDLAAGREVAVQTLIDGTFPYRAEVASGYASAIVARFARESALVAAAIPARVREPAGAIDLEIRYLFNEPLESLWSIGPATLMLVLMILPPILTAVGVVREKERGSIDALRASPLRRSEFVLGKWLPYFLVATANFLVLWAIAVGVFGAPFRGNPWFFLLASIVYVACTSGLGLVVSLLVRSQIAAILVTMIVALVPTMLYSGMITPLSSLSEAGRLQANLLPATYYNRIVAGSFLKGTDPSSQWIDVAGLAAYGLLTFVAGIALFTKRARQ
ncbi:MAG: ABC transporter permease [Phycisphaerales bacterium]